MNVITRQTAKSLGLKRYFTGKPCKHGHLSERFVSTTHCCECLSAFGRSYYVAHPEKTQERVRRNREANPEKFREWARRYQANNPEKVRENSRRYRATDKAKESLRRWKIINPEKAAEYIRRYRTANPEKAREQYYRYRTANPEKMREQNREQKRRSYADPIKKLIFIQRVIVRKSLKGKHKSKKTLAYVGCTPKFLFAYLSKLIIGTDFTWDNYGDVWHIDHIKPLTSFDLSYEQNRMIAFNWLNMRPLAKADNLRKHTSVPTDAELRDIYYSNLELTRDVISANTDQIVFRIDQYLPVL
jgi:hypothetical protein